MSLHDDLVLAIRSRKAKKHNDRWSFQCTRHDDKNPSAWLGEGAWGCMACGFKEPLDSLAHDLGVSVEAKGYTLDDYAAAKRFPIGKLQSFGLTTESQRGFSVVAIPYFDADGRVLRRRFRSDKGKWWEGRNLPIYLYGLDRLVDAKKGEPVIVVEGESDCHAAWLHGFHAVGVPGATTWKSEWKKHLDGLDIYVWEEPDQGGPQLVASIARDFPDAKVLTPPSGVKDMADLHAKKGAGFADELRSLMAMAVRVGTPKPPVVFDPLLSTRLNALLARKLEPVDAVPTPWPTWSALCGGDGGKIGFARGWHVIAAAKTGTGKSILALNVAAWAVRNGERVCFVSLEMEQGELETRMLAILSGEPVWRMEKGRQFDTETFKRAGRKVLELHELNGGTFLSNREPIHDLESVIDSIRYNHEVHGCRFFIVDYLQLAGNAMDPESVARVSHAVRRTAKDMRVVTLGLSQFNRSTSASPDRPTKEGLMGGSPLENDADQVLLIDHSRMDKDVEGWRSYALLEKNRHGPVAEIPIAFDTETLRMRERMPDELPASEVAA